jgi:hypothetical protein
VRRPATVPSEPGIEILRGTTTALPGNVRGHEQGSGRPARRRQTGLDPVMRRVLVELDLESRSLRRGSCDGRVDVLSELGVPACSTVTITHRRRRTPWPRGVVGCKRASATVPNRFGRGHGVPIPRPPLVSPPRRPAPPERAGGSPRPVRRPGPGVVAG